MLRHTQGVRMLGGGAGVLYGVAESSRMHSTALASSSSSGLYCFIYWSASRVHKHVMLHLCAALLRLLLPNKRWLAVLGAAMQYNVAKRAQGCCSLTRGMKHRSKMPGRGRCPSSCKQWGLHGMAWAAPALQTPHSRSVVVAAVVACNMCAEVLFIRPQALLNEAACEVMWDVCP